MRWVFILIAIAVSACGPQPTPPPEKVNLVILSIDTLRPDHLGLYGYPHPTSPNLDRFADRSAVFDQAVTVHVATAPAHATMLTGRYPGSHGIQRNGMSLAPDVPTLGGILSDDGWVTGAFVSGWTLHHHTGLDRGFSIYDDDIGERGNGAHRAGSSTTDAALAWLEGRVADDERFFLFLHLFEPHWPYDPPARDALRFLPGQYELTTIGKPVHLDRMKSVNRLNHYEQREYIARYDGEIVVADRLLDSLLDRLEDLGVTHNTVVIVLADHGETLFEREWTMDHGTRPYDEQARIPMILHVPGENFGGHRVAEQVSLLDVVPTVLDIFAIAPPTGIQGRSLMGLARGEAIDWSPRPAFITARSQPERLPHIQIPISASGLVRAVRFPGVKLIEYPKSNDRWHPELFNLLEDPGETIDRSPDRPDAVLELHDELVAWRSSAGAASDATLPSLDPDVEAALRELGYIDD